MDLTKELKKKTVEYESNSYTNYKWCSWYNHQRIGTKTRGLGNNGMRGDYPNYTTIVISKNTEKSPGGLRRLAVTQTPVKDHQ